MHLILQDGSRLVHKPFGSIVKFLLSHGARVTAFKRNADGAQGIFELPGVYELRSHHKKTL